MIDAFDDLYLWFFLSSLVILLCLEKVPWLRRQNVRYARRWSSNFGLLLCSSLISGLLLPAGLVVYTSEQPAGFLSGLALPLWGQVILTCLIIDGWRYWEHRWFHQFSLLWRLHLVHHSDTDVDVTTTERHHPLESTVTLGALLALIHVAGLPAFGVAVYLLLAMVVSLLSHANVELAPNFDRILRQVMVTPGFHAVHHSDAREQTDSNYGTVLTLWDRLFGTYSDPEQVRIPHFGLSYFHLERDLAFHRVFLQPFLYRRGMAYPARQARSFPNACIANVSAQPLSTAWRQALSVLAMVLVCVAILYWPTLEGLMVIWGSNESYQYAWLVIPLLVYLIGWHYRDEMFSEPPQYDRIGLLFVFLGALFWSFSRLIGVNAGEHIALVVVLQGLAMTIWGWRAYWQFLPVFALLFFVVPIGDVLQPLLRKLTIESIGLYASIVGLPSQIDGFVAYIGNHRYIVIDECAGLTFVTLALFLGYSFGVLLYRNKFKIFFLMILGGVLGILSNVVRVTMIVQIDWWNASQMELTAHGGFQWLALFGTLALLFLLLAFLKGDESPVREQNVPSGEVSRFRRWMPVGGILALAPLVIMTNGVVGASLSTSHDLDTAALPSKIMHWTQVQNDALWQPEPDTHIKLLKSRYLASAQEVGLTVIEPMNAAAKLPVSRLKPQEKEHWREGKVAKMTSCDQTHCIRLIHTTWQSRDQAQRHAYHVYAIGNFMTDSKLVFRLVKSWYRLKGEKDSGRVISLMFEEYAPSDRELTMAFHSIQSSLRRI